jgi:hypothetical protein
MHLHVRQILAFLHICNREEFFILYDGSFCVKSQVAQMFDFDSFLAPKAKLPVRILLGEECEDEERQLQLVYLHHEKVTRSRFPTGFSFVVEIGKTVEQTRSSDNVLEHGGLAIPRVPRIVNKTITGLAGTRVLVHKVMIVNGEHGVVEE